jgi:hypothetical protein
VRLTEISAFVLIIPVAFFMCLDPSAAVGSLARGTTGGGLKAKEDILTLKTIRHLAKRVKKDAVIMSYELEVPQRWMGKAANVVGPVVIQPIPQPDGIVTVCTLVPPNRRMLSFIAKDMGQDIDKALQLAIRYSTTGGTRPSDVWSALKKDISSLKESNRDLDALLAEKRPLRSEIDSKIVDIFVLSKTIEKGSEALWRQESSQIAASNNGNI